MPRRPRIAFATDAAHPRLTSDDRLAADHLEKNGLAVTPAVWDDPRLDWRAFDAVVVRSCWDYHLRPGDFDAWLDRLEALGVEARNPVPMLRWSCRKTYLEDLRAAGFDVVPTLYLERGKAARLEDLMARLGREELVLKPPVGASAHGLWSAGRRRLEDGQRRLDAALEDGDLMAQPRLPEVETAGEWSLVYFGGDFSHALVKRPRPGDFRVQEELGGTIAWRSPPESLRAAAERLVAWLDAAPLYARADLVEVGGRAVIMELELVEPCLYFYLEPASPERFGRALVAGL